VPPGGAGDALARRTPPPIDDPADFCVMLKERRSRAYKAPSDLAPFFSHSFPTPGHYRAGVCDLL